MIAGRMRHRDSAGHEGLLENGGVQWMTAGRGVIHSEIPEQEEGRMEGFQLWLNLPARDKMRTPWYRDFSAAELPRLTTPEGTAGGRSVAKAQQCVRGAVAPCAAALPSLAPVQTGCACCGPSSCDCRLVLIE